LRLQKSGGWMRLHSGGRVRTRSNRSVTVTITAIGYFADHHSRAEGTAKKFHESGGDIMERYSARTIDEVGRLVLHSDLRQRLGLETGDTVSLTVVGTIAIMQRVEDISEGETWPVCVLSTVNEIGMFELPAELRKWLGWETKDRIAMYHTDDLAILQLAEKK
jgi:bifunctional DNA-binding transcriptional regulator/antitoxin component of YhaV-PrlF toxin-antitoxin module